MKTSHAGLAFLISCLVFAAACTKQPSPGQQSSAGQQPAPLKTDKNITIEAGGSLGCEVDFPVAVVYISKHYPRWISADNEYWIHFVGGKNPFIGVDPIDVPARGKSKQLDITGPPDYYTYEIWSQPDTSTSQHKTCKGANDERDTGLNVKR